MIALSRGIKLSAMHHLDLSQSTHVTDGRTDGRKDRRQDRITTPKTVLAYVRAVTTASVNSIRHKVKRS